MDRATRHCLQSYLDDITNRYNTEKARLEQLNDYSAKRLKVTHDKDGRSYYSIYDPEKNAFVYAGKCRNEEIAKIKQAHYLKLMVDELRRERLLIERTISMSHDLDHEAIEKKMKKAYRGSFIPGTMLSAGKESEWKESMDQYKANFEPFMPEELIHRTRDGTYVRSKSEALIYNDLLELGVTFIYELPLRITYYHKKTLLLPDFTILSEIDFESVIYIEHQGMMNTPSYRNKFNESVYKYWLNGYLPERDVFFTFDSPNGGFDDTPVKSIIRKHVKPL